MGREVMSIVAVEVLSNVSQFLIPSMARANFIREQQFSIIKTNKKKYWGHWAARFCQFPQSN